MFVLEKYTREDQGYHVVVLATAREVDQLKLYAGGNLNWTYTLDHSYVSEELNDVYYKISKIKIV